MHANHAYAKRRLLHLTYTVKNSCLRIKLHFNGQSKSCMLATRQAPASQRKSRPLKRARPDSGTASGSGSDGEDAEDNEESPLVITLVGSQQLPAASAMRVLMSMRSSGHVPLNWLSCLLEDSSFDAL